MRSFRRPPRSDLPVDQAVLAGVAAVAGPAGQRVGAQGGVVGEEPPRRAELTGDRFDLRTTEVGLVIGPSAWTALEMPSLVPWSVVAGVTVEAAELADGSRWPVLEISVTDRQWFDRGNSKQFVVTSSTDVRPFLRAVEAGQASTRSLGSAHEATGLRSWWVEDRRRQRRGEPQHGLGRRRIGPVAVALLALILLAGSTSNSFGSSTTTASRHRIPSINRGNGAQASRVRASVSLPPATAAPAPAPPSLAATPPLQSHEIFGYAPYWTLPQSSGFDVKSLTTLAYFSVDANANGTLDQSGSGWNGYQSQDLADLVTRSHAAGDRVVLTVTCFSQSSLNAITSDPNAAARLSSALIAAVSAKNLDGVNFDFEGQGSADRHGLTALITQVSGALHAANPHWQVTMATYASAASDGAGFYDVAALAPAIDGFFVMAYDMNDRVTPSATAPLTGGGFNDTQALQQFTAVVPAKKVILGVPFYGYDWPTTDGTRTAQPTGGEQPLSNGVITASGHPTYWDPPTQTAWTSYQVGTQWHETFFDNPTSLALKAQLANSFHIGGMGIWALGMDGNNPAMLAALLGSAPAVKDYQAGPTATLPSVPPGTGFVTTGVWNGTTVPLTPVVPPTSYGDVQYLGTLTGVQTTAPALACLQSGPPIGVWTFSALPGVDVVVASQPDDCVSGMWTFPPPAGATSGSTTTTGPPTTEPPTTTTTTTSVPPTSTTTTVPATTTTTVPATTTTTGP
jgi:spore germination protein YaaH